MLRTVKPKNARSKRALVKREPKLIENTKQALFLRGTKTSQVVGDVLRELCSLKKPDAVSFSKRNEIKPFEDATPLEFLSTKNDTSLIVLGNHQKKRPHNVTFVRMFDHRVLDIIEFGVDKFKSMKEFSAKAAMGMRPLMSFSGDLFDHNETYGKIKNYFMDFFKGAHADQIDLRGLEHIITFTAEPVEPPQTQGRIFMRVYCIKMKKSGTKLPRIELEEMGPSIDFVLRRTQFAPQDIRKEALKTPKELKPKKQKNIEHDILGDKVGRVHMKSQDLEKLQTRKMKGLKKRPREEEDGPRKKVRNE